MSHAQSVTGYQQPPDPIPAILDAPTPTWLLVSPDQRQALELSARTLPGIAELAVPAVEVAGVRLNPRTNGEANQTFIAGMTLVNLETLERRELELPRPLRIHDVRWSPDNQRLSWCCSGDDGISLWITDLANGDSAPIPGLRLNGALGTSYLWLSDGSAIVCLRVPADRGAPPEAGPPTGPVILENRGQTAAGRTYPYLLKTDHDEALFEYYCAAELVEVPLSGEPRRILSAGIFTDFGISPDGRFLTVERALPPWSRSLPLWQFAQQTSVVDRTGRELRVVSQLPLADQIPISFGSVRTGPRQIRWRADEAATVFWAEALDGGDAGSPAAERDALYLLTEPFDAAPKEIARLEFRFAGLVWGRSEFALLMEYWHKTRRQRVWGLIPGNGKRKLLLDRDSEDAWTEPGVAATKRNELGRSTLRFSPDGNWIYWTGRGVGPEGVHPYLDRMRIKDGARERLWQSADPWYEQVEEMLDDKGERLLVNRQSATEPGNDWLLEMPESTKKRPRGTAAFRARQVTHFEDPAPQLAGLQKEVLRYKRADGVDLSATLYLPPGYQRGVDPPLPALFWVYPREFKSRDAAGRVTATETTFSRPGGISVLFLLLHGYAVVADPTMPILGEDGAEPNDSYVEQLQAGALAAVEHVASLGVVDTSRLAIGGHSYGAFTAANLLAHTDLFRTAICRSGAYNRTLTPFGFQGEDRSLWVAPDVYLKMSPFHHADTIKEPVLMIHGMEDPNSGTFPIQSDRFYEALKGLGAEVRLVRLPAEGHDYRARESVGHVLWEMITWCDKHVKDAASSVNEASPTGQDPATMPPSDSAGE